MQDWYERYYAAIEHSAAYAAFCRSVFGRDLGQHGFADMVQVRLLVDALRVDPADRIVDLGCGTGGIASEIARLTRADVVGIDYIRRAVLLARRRHGGPNTQFVAADMGALCFERSSFNVAVSIDTLYFTPIRETVGAIARLLKPQGRMGILYSHGADPEHPLPAFDRSELAPDHTPLASALRDLGLPYTAQNLTDADRRHALRKKAVLKDLQPLFAGEGNEFLFENRFGEANGVLAAIEAGAHARYLYIVTRMED